MSELNTLDQTWLLAIEHVRLGSFSSRKRFRANVQENGVRTDRQRWWLAMLVVMHRRQISSDYAVATAAAFINAHPEHDVRKKLSCCAPAPNKPIVQPRNLDLFGNWT